jgi:hypothetical protein
MPTSKEVLAPNFEQIPTWLNQDVAPQFTPDTFASFLNSRVMYYPGSGTDGHALKLFGGTHSAHCFLHCDHAMNLDEVAERLRPPHPLHPAGYHPLNLQILCAEEIQQVICIDPPMHCGLDAIGGWPGSELAGAIWAVLQRQEGFGDEHGPRRPV